MKQTINEMAHELHIINGRASMAYLGALPWHKLGQAMPENATLEDWIEAAGMNFEVLSSPVRYLVGDIIREMTGRNVLHRSDTGTALSVVSDQYKVVQPATVMEFFRDLTRDLGMTMETAGVLKEGATYWALAKTGQSASIANPSDKINGFVLLSTSCDGSMATTGKLTSIRVVCNNTLSLAMQRHDGAAIKTRHSTDFKPDAVKKALGLIDYNKSWNSFIDSMRALCDKPVNPDQARDYFRELLSPGRDVKDYAAQSFHDLMTGPARTGNHKATVEKDPKGFAPLWETYCSGTGQHGITGTAYGLVNAVTRYVDHERNKSNPDGRLHSAWFGQGDAMKTRALETAMAL